MIAIQGITPKVRKLYPDEETVEDATFQQAVYTDNPDRIRGIRNTAAYGGLYYSQWDSELIYNLLGQRRSPEQYNLLNYFVQGLAGNYIANWYDPRFVPMRDEDIDTMKSYQESYYICKDNFGYKDEAMKNIVRGLCYRGIEEVFIDRSVNPNGDIRFRNRREDMTIFPTVLGDDISGGAQECWNISYLDPWTMMAMFDYAKDPILSKLAEMAKKRGKVFERLDFTTFADPNMKRQFGDKWLIYEHLHLDLEKKTKQIDQLSGLTVPSVPVEMQKEWAAKNGVDLALSENLGMLVGVTTYDKVLWCTTRCPDLHITLENRIDERQIGRLPLFAWSFLTMGGKSIGMVDLLWDVQQTFNKVQVAKRQYLTQTPKGKPVINEDAFMGKNDYKKRAISEWSDPSKPMMLPGGAPPASQVISQLPNQEPPQALYSSEQMLLELANLIARLPPAMQGRSERTNESGILYGRKVIEGQIQQRIPLQTIERHEHDKAVAWVKLGMVVFGGKNNYNRDFVAEAGQRKVTLNIDEGFGDNGQRNLRNDVTAIEMPNIIVSMSKENDYAKQLNREMDAAVLQAMNQSQDPSNLESKAIMESRLIQASDFTDSSEKKSVEEAMQRRLQLVALQMENATLAAQDQNNMLKAKLSGKLPPQNKPPSLSASYKDIPPDAQQKALEEMGLRIAQPQQGQQPDPAEQVAQPEDVRAPVAAEQVAQPEDVRAPVAPVQ
jgi:hypothetical protein